MTEPDAREIARLRAVLQEICEHEECCCEGGFFDRFCTLCTARGALEDHSGGRQPAVEGHHGDAETLPAAIKRLEGLIAGTDNLVTDANWDTARVEFGRADIDALKLVVKTLKGDDTTMRAARTFFEAATAWADLREHAHPNDKREQEAWDRLYALYSSR